MNTTLAREPAQATATIEVTMPATGSETQVTVSAWLKHPGDSVVEQEPICLVDFSGSSAEIGSPATGVLRMVTVAAGERVTVGAALAVIDQGVELQARGRF